MANEQAKAFIDQATQSLQNSQFQQALELVDQAIAIEPGASDSQVLRGICLSQLGQPDAATEAFRKAIMLSPYNAKAYYNLAVHYNGLGNKKEACELAREAVSVDPRHAAAKQLLLQLEKELAGPVHGPTGTGGELPGAYDNVQAPPRPGQMPNEPGGILEPHSAASEAPAPGAPPAQPRPPTETAPPAGGPYTPPPSGPYAPTGGSQFSPAGYQRPGYDQPAHALPWVEGMGSGWVAIGWIIAALSLVLFGVLVVTYISVFQQAFQNGANSAATNSSMNTIALGPLGLFFLFVRVLGLFWFLFDVMDRRTGWGWFVVYVILCCCGFPWIILPIYILAGRK
ncbi:MAG TPA: tetratricopeptide repeat protein [Fimbriimonadaceae bacterium]|nr:tetratricopeptide repeat protein [Fimbriimonadaceae bacterium]